ncbi:MAG: hypothetical protein ACF8CY_01035 [Gimesia chilikensis]
METTKRRFSPVKGELPSPLSPPSGSASRQQLTLWDFWIFLFQTPACRIHWYRGNWKLHKTA